MLLFIILNFLFIWIYQANTAYYDTFVSKKVRLLNDGNIMPTLAYGAAADNVNELDEIYEAVLSAIEIGYRHVDTAAALLYTNEEAVGQAICDAISRGIVTRAELFVTAKLELDADRRKKVVPALKRTLKRLQLDYVDLFLIVTPYNPLRSKKFDVLDIWYGMEDAKALNLTNSIGVSNFDRENLYRILSHCTTKPAVIQIEVNPTFTNAELVQYCQEQGIIVMAFGPLGYTVPRPGVCKGLPTLDLDNPVFVKIAKKYCVTPSQVVLRQSIDKGNLPISRSMNKKRIQSNIDLLDFCLTDEEVAIIDGFNINIQVYPYNNTKVVEYYKIEFQSKRRNK